MIELDTNWIVVYNSLSKKGTGRKRKYVDYRTRRRANPIPKLLKNDIKKFIPVMYANALNSGDPEFFNEYLKTHCTADCKVNIKHTLYRPGGVDMLILQARGTNHLYWRYLYLSSRFPDFYIEVSDIRLIRRNDTESYKVICRIKTNGTDPLINCPYHLQYPYNENTFMKTLDLEKDMPIDDFVNCLQNVGKISIDGEMHLTVNDQHIITSLTII